jgi:hypothetical protein
MKNLPPTTQYEQEYEQDLGPKLWNALRELNAKYSSVDISSKFKGSFDADYWEVSKNGTRKKDFKWNSWLPLKSQYPLLLLCKVCAYTQIFKYKKAVSTVQSNISAFLNAFTPIMTDKNVLINEPETAFSSMLELTSLDMAVYAQSHLEYKGTISEPPLLGIDKLRQLGTLELGESHFLTLGVTTPWEEAGLSVGKYLESLRKSLEKEVERTPYPPFNIESISDIVTNAIMIINEYGDTIEGIFDIVEEHNKHGNKSLQVPISATKPIMKKYGKKISEILPMKTLTYGTGDGWYTDLRVMTQQACAWIILLTTALRNCDMRELSKGCCVKSDRSDLIYYLVSDIQKTHLPNYVLPVPKITYDAVKLASKATTFRDGGSLFQKKNTMGDDNRLGDPRKMGEESTLNSFLMGFGDWFGFKIETITGQKPSCHCARPTLAGFIGATSDASILILKRLFGHSNMLMPDAYLFHNPIVIKERINSVTKGQQELADQMAKAVVNKKVGGKKGKQLMKGSEVMKARLKSETSEVITEMDMQTTLTRRMRELLLHRITNNQMFAILTPVSVICCRTVSDTTESPCAKQALQEQRKNKNIKKAITDALATLPNPANCVGVSCSDALVGAPWSDSLLGTFDWYIQYLDSLNKSYQIELEAKTFVKAYAHTLKEIYEDKREEEYFDR